MTPRFYPSRADLRRPTGAAAASVTLASVRRLALFLSLIVLLAAGCGGAETAAPTAVEVEGTVPTETAPAETGMQGTGTQETEEEEDTGPGETTATAPPGEEAKGDAKAGAEVFTSGGCGGCHAFEAAKSSGTAGPSLDESDIGFDDAVDQIANGGGGMPPFKGRLSEKEIDDVAAFVVESRKD